MSTEIARLGHVALETPDLAESSWFFGEVLGLRETERVGDTIYFSGQRDWAHHTLSVSEGMTGQVDHIGWQTQRESDVEAFAAELEGETEITRVPAGDEPAQGEAIRFSVPSGHTFELYGTMEKTSPGEKKSRLKNRNHSLTSANRIAPRRIDHATVGDSDPTEYASWIKDNLGFRAIERIEDTDGSVLGEWLSVTAQNHDTAAVRKEVPSGLHHVAYYLESLQDLYDAADIVRENGIDIDGGPGRHGVSQANYLYVKDPASGHRVELYTGGYLVFDPHWEPIVWRGEEAADAKSWFGTSSSNEVSPYRG